MSIPASIFNAVYLEMGSKFNSLYDGMSCHPYGKFYASGRPSYEEKELFTGRLPS